MLDEFSKLPPSRTKILGHTNDYRNVEDIFRFQCDMLEIKDDFFSEKSSAGRIVSQSAKHNRFEPYDIVQEGKKGQKNAKRA